MYSKFKEKFNQSKKDSRINIIFIFVPLIIILFFEFGIFNLNYWQTCTINEVDLTKQSQISSSKWLIPANGNIKTLNVKVKVKMTIRIYISDEGHGQYTQVASISPDPNNPNGETVMLNNYGLVNSIMLLPINNSDEEDNIEKDMTTTRITDMTQIESVSVNKTIPFTISGLRLTIMLAMYVLIIIFKPNSKIFSIKAKSKLGKKIIIWLTAILCIISAWFTFNSPAAGQFNFDEQGNYDGFEYVKKHHAQYNQLADSFLNGRLDLIKEPPAFLKDMKNPYDTTIRSRLEKSTEQEVQKDTAYYNGRYYVYFGVLPCLTMFLPFKAITGLDFPAVFGIIVMIILFIIGLSMSIWSVMTRKYPKTSLGVLILTLIGSLFSTCITMAITMASFYVLPTVMALALLIWGAFFFTKSKHHKAFMILGCTCLALTFACRPQIGILSILLLPLGIHYLIEVKGAWNKILLIIGVTLPFIIVALSLAWYNYSRFGSIADFGANYNLTFNDMTHRTPSLELMFKSLFYYFIAPFQFTPDFPFLKAFQPEFKFTGTPVVEQIHGGCFFIAPFIALGIYTFSQKKIAIKIFGVFIILVTLFIASLDALAAGIVERYQMDFMIALSMLACYGIMYEEQTFTTKRHKKHFHIILASLTFATVLIGIMLIYDTDFVTRTIGYSNYWG